MNMSHMHTGEEAVVLYSQLPDGVLDLYHTEVPTSQRGKGLGALLAEVGGRGDTCMTWGCAALTKAIPIPHMDISLSYSFIDC